MSIKKELFDAILDQVPVLKYFKQTVWSYLIPELRPYSRIDKDLDEYCTYLKESKGIDRKNPGSLLAQLMT